MGQSCLAQSDIALNNSSLLSLKGWYYFGQLLIESTYLQPFKLTSNGIQQEKRVKNNTHNGYIEREIHGAMHASRVAWSTMMLHRLCEQQYPEQVPNKIQALLKFSHLSKEELFYLIRYVGLGHDAAREGDGTDKWENKSATCIALFLKEHGLNSQLAIIFSHLASLKDKPQELAKYLAFFKLPSDVIEGLQYVRLLVSLADCFDIIRCNGSFNFAFIERKLAEVFPYSKDKDASVFFDYAKHMLLLLKRQKDLYFPTQLIWPNKESFSLDEDGEEDYSVQEKVKLEHADYAPAAMLASLNKDLYFQQLLNTEAPEYSNPYDKEPAFNPYIHGTNSAALALMTQTDFRLMSAIEMLEQYRLAPLCGELTQGGFSTAIADCKPCFARLHGEDNSNEYSLKKIIRDYAKVNEGEPKQKYLDNLRNYGTNPSRRLFSTISIINIYLAGARQLGFNLLEIPEIQSLEKDFQRSMDIFYLYLLFSTHIVAKKNGTLSFEEQNVLACEMETHLSLQQVLEKLHQSNISIRDIYNNPTAENCQKIITLLTLPKHCKVQQLFEYTKEPLKKVKDHNELEKQWGYIVGNVSSWSLDCMLYGAYTRRYKRVDFQRVAPHLLRYMEILEKRFLVTQSLLQDPQKPLILSDEDADLVQNPLPIILCYDQGRHMRIFLMESQEYRVQKPLKLGEDIQTIATDTETNMKRLKAYSDRHHLNLNIISFADLERAHSFLSTEHPFLSSQQVVLGRSVDTDIAALRNFVSEQQVRFDQSSVRESLAHFHGEAKKIVFSTLSSVEKRTQLKACAHHEFKHRHYVPRLLADALILISSLALVGLAVGITRTLTGHSFFFSAEKTRRETEFIKIADTMDLSFRT